MTKAQQIATRISMNCFKSGNCPLCAHAGDKVAGTIPVQLQRGVYVYFCAEHTFSDLVQEIEYELEQSHE